MKKVAIFAIGTHGDIRPFVALGLELKVQGYLVTIVTNEKNHAFCQEKDVNYAIISGDLSSSDLLIEGLRQEVENEISILKRSKFLKMVFQEFNSLLNIQLEEIILIAKQSDILVYHPSVFLVPHIGQSLKKPSFQIQLQPELCTFEHPSCFAQSKPLFGKLGNFISHLMFEQLFWQPLRKNINRCRNKLNLPKTSFFGPKYDKQLNKQPLCIAVSPSLIPRPKNWKTHVHMTGFLRLLADENFRPSDSLQLFLNRGKPPIYFGLGSAELICPKRIITAFVKIVEKHKLRAIISKNLPIHDIKLSDNFFVSDFCPHDWLFPKVSCLIHSGGIGITAAGLYAAKPSLVLPFATDQFFWGRKIAEIGMGPTPIALRSLKNSEFEQAIVNLHINKSYQQKTEFLSRKLKNEDAISSIIKVIVSSREIA